MRASRLIKEFLAPVVAAGAVSIAGANPHETAIGSITLLPVIGLLVLLILSIGTIVWTRWEHRRRKRNGRRGDA